MVSREDSEMDFKLRQMADKDTGEGACATRACPASVFLSSAQVCPSASRIAANIPLEIDVWRRHPRRSLSGAASVELHNHGAGNRRSGRTAVQAVFDEHAHGDSRRTVHHPRDEQRVVALFVGDVLFF